MNMGGLPPIQHSDSFGRDGHVEEMDDADSKLEVGNELVYDTLWWPLTRPSVTKVTYTK